MPTVEAHKATIYYETLGSGPAVVFAHGRGGNAASWWRQVPVFAKKYQAIAFDHRCFGRSTCAREDFDRAQFDKDLLAILDAEGIEKTAIVCQSMGGWTGLAMALNYPERVTCLILSNTPGGADFPLAREYLAKSSQIFAERGLGRAPLADNYHKRNPEGAYLYAQIGGLNINLPNFQPDGRNGVSPERMKALKAPTLFITSAHDEIFPPKVIREIHEGTPGSEFIELPVAGHSPYFEIPDVFNETVSAFLARHL